MSVKNPRDGLSFDDVFKCLAEKDMQSRVFVGNNTYVEWIESPTSDSQGFIAMTYHETKVVNFLDPDTVQLFHGGYRTKNTGVRMDWALLPLGFRMTFRGGQYKVYSIKTGAYRGYTAGMIVERGAF